MDNEDSIRRHGLVGGWQGPLGGFVSQHYGDEEYGPTSDEDEVVYLTDKQKLSKALTAMVFHIGKKLGKDFHDVTDNDILNHGLLVVVRDSEGVDQADDSGYRSYPRGVEPFDYYTSETGADAFIKGRALLRMLKQYGVWPRTWGAASAGRADAIRGQLTRTAIGQYPQRPKTDVIQHFKGLSPDKLEKTFGRWQRT